MHGKLQTLDLPVLGPAETKGLAYSVLTDTQKKRFEESLELDFSFGIRVQRRALYRTGTRGGRLLPGRPIPAPATTPAPRLIICSSSSRSDEALIAVSSVMSRF